MVSLTIEQNEYLSYLLDEVTGTEEIVKIRKDLCKIQECIVACYDGKRKYFTGSKAEGLDLPGSDHDFMYDINDSYDTEVSESAPDLIQSTRKNKILIVTDKVSPAFALLKCVSLEHQHLVSSAVNRRDGVYLSSQSFMRFSPQLTHDPTIETHKIQGPSIEMWNQYENTYESGRDNVFSILCKAWPTSAAEWKDRPRQYGWPLQHDKKNIEAFGCHLVAVGHPLSTTRSLEWRTSFSIAERTLVWSFNHTQLQCYAVMKLILKEFVKPNCAEEHKGVLCSYFIKTFLFWQFESTDQLFWQRKNLTGCLMYLLHEFNKCIQSGTLRHYFVPRFNLMEIKLTREAQRQLLQIFIKICKSGVAILGQCVSLSSVWSKFLEAGIRGRSQTITDENMRKRILYNDTAFMEKLYVHIFHALTAVHRNSCSYENMLREVIKLTNEEPFSTSLSAFVIMRLCVLILTEQSLKGFLKRNRIMYSYMRTLDLNIYGTDISSTKLWLATFLLQQGDYFGSLQRVNDVLSSIPPYAIYYSGYILTNDDLKQLYVDTNCIKNSVLMCRAKNAWLVDMYFTTEEHSFLPRAIQIQLQYCDPKWGIRISPFIYAYYLMFLCYHGLDQYDNRDRALRQLVDTVNDRERCGVYIDHSYNIVGHCMLMAGYVDMALNIFLESAQFTHSMPAPAFDKYNAAYKYLSLM